MEQYSEKQLKIFQNFYESCRKKEIDPTGSEADKQRALLLAQENADLVQIFGEKLDGGHVEAYRMGKQRVEEQAAAEKKAAKEAKIAEQRRIDEQAAALEKAISKLYGRDKRLFFLQQELDAAVKNQKEVKEVVDRWVQRYEQADKGSKGSSWGTMGGIAAGITGSTAVGAVVAADAMNRDADTRAQNAALKYDLLQQAPHYDSMMKHAASRVKNAQAEIEKAKLSLMEEYPLVELMDGISLGEPQIAFTPGNTMLIQIGVSAKSYQIAEVPAVLDGCFVAEIYEEEQKVGEAFLNFPRDGITTKQQILKGHCIEARPGVSYTVLILPVALWVIEKYKFSAEVPTLEKLIPTYSKKFTWKAIHIRNVSWQRRLEELHLEAERRTEEARKAEEARKVAVAERAKKNKKIAMIATPIVAIVVIAGALIWNNLQKNQQNDSDYQRAIALMESGEYDAAISAFEELGDYKDSAEQINNVRYTEALELVQEGRYDDAISIFTELGDYRDSAEQVEITQGLQAEAELLMQYQTAIDLLNTEPDTEQYYDAVSESREILEDLGDYRDCEELLKDFYLVTIRRTGNTNYGPFEYYYGYDSEGKLIGDGARVYIYGDDGRVTGFRTSDGTATVTSYDENGRMLSAEDAYAVYTFNYDSDGRLIEISRTSSYSGNTNRDTYGYTDENGTVLSEGEQMCYLGWIYAPEKNK